MTWLRTVAVTLALLVPGASAAVAQPHALVVTGASGGPEYAERFDRWRSTFVSLLRRNYGYTEDRMIVLAERQGPGIQAATATGVRAAFERLNRVATAADVVFVLLMGHGSVFEGDDAKFNLVGPDLTMDEWATLVDAVAARVVFINTTAGSSPFLARLAARNRIVITATDTVAQRYMTVFPEFFVQAFEDREADANGDNQISVWEAFEFASSGVRDWFADHGLPATERALLDDTGAGIGREAGAAGTDGAMAQQTFLRPPRPGSS
jgi:hypothetical protein